MTPEQKDQIRTLWFLGLSYHKIAAVMKVTIGVIAGACFRLGLKRDEQLLLLPAPVDSLPEPLPSSKPKRKPKPKLAPQLKTLSTASWPQSSKEALEKIIEPDTSDIPEVGEDWFQKARLVKPVKYEETEFDRMQSDQCKWPMDKFGGQYNLMVFCGKKRMSLNCPYCVVHAEKAGRKFYVR